MIDNRDSAPLEVTGFKAEENVYECVFLAAPDKRYRLVYGALDAEQATYDTAAVQELLRERFQPSRAELGVQQTGQAAVQQPAFRWSRFLNNLPLLGAVITLLVILLGWGLTRR